MRKRPVQGAIAPAAVDKAVTTYFPTAGDISPKPATNPSVFAEFIPYPTAGAEREDPGVGHIDIGSLQYLSPPEDPYKAYEIYQLSPYLSPHIRAMESNVYGAGYELVLDEALDCDEAVLLRRIKRSLQFALSAGPESVPEISDKEVLAWKRSLDQRILWEEHYLKLFFAACCPDMDYLELEALTGQDLEITGNAYHEVLRDMQGRVARFNWMPSKHTRAVPIPLGVPRIGVMQRVRDPILGFRLEPQHRKFRTYALLSTNTNMVQTYFKEFGDPRVCSRATGVFYGLGPEGIARLQEYEPSVLPATEIYHYRLPFGGSTAYGKAEWSGIHTTLEGSRDLDEENLKFINDEVLPSLLVAVAGPRIGEEERKRFEEQIKNRAKGSGRGFLFLNAYEQSKAMGRATATAQIHIEKLKSEQINEQIFGRYDERAELKTHMAWRLPSIALGVVPERMDKGAAMLLNRFAEDQVYNPRRCWYARAKDRVLDEIGIQCWRYRVRSVPPRDPESLAKIIEILMNSGVLTPDEGRNLSQVIFNTRFSDLPGVWSQLPTKLLIAVLQTKNPTLASALLLPDGTLSMERLSDILVKGMASAAAGQVQGDESDDEEPGLSDETRTDSDSDSDS